MLVVVDTYSKWVEAFPSSNEEAKNSGIVQSEVGLCSSPRAVVYAIHTKGKDWTKPPRDSHWQTYENDCISTSLTH